MKFQAIYPPDPPVVGYVRNEPIYLRDYVHELNGRDNWLKEARVVKINEKSYKQVKARPRFDRVSFIYYFINHIYGLNYFSFYRMVCEQILRH